MFSGSSGEITSPDYYSRTNYKDSQNCQFDIRVSSGYAVKLTWTTFDVKGDMPNCYDDYVEIYIGCSRKSIGRYCSDNSYKPHDIYSPDNCLRIKFRSDGSGSGKGFSAQYSTMSKSFFGKYLLHVYKRKEVPYPCPYEFNCSWVHISGELLYYIYMMPFYLVWNVRACQSDKYEILFCSRYLLLYFFISLVH